MRLALLVFLLAVFGACVFPPPPPATVTSAPVKKAPGAACDEAAECASGICEGQGCGPGEGVCRASDRMCTQDLRPYCGCDGQTFSASGGCPGKRYSARGGCPAK
jgi:hypothetical protein